MRIGRWLGVAGLVAVVGLGLVMMRTGRLGMAAAGETLPAARDASVVMAELDQATKALEPAYVPARVLLDDKTRAELGPKLVPLVKRVADLSEEAGEATGDAGLLSQALQLQGMLVFLGDGDAQKKLQAVMGGKDAGRALEAKLNLAQGNWWKDNKEAEAQGKILDQLEAVAKAHPTDDSLTEMFLDLQSTGAANDAVKNRVHDIITKDMTGEVAQVVQHAPVVGKPLSVSGAMLNGKTFDTRSLAGKVVLVDVWATWCPPCMAEMPELVKLKEKYEGKAFGMVGVSVDHSAQDLKDFLGENKDVSWPMLYEDDSAIGNRYGVVFYPTKFIIDAKGVLRYVVTTSDYDTHDLYMKAIQDDIDGLLAEKGGGGGSSK